MSIATREPVAIAVALIPILVVAGYVASGQAELWLGLAAAVLGVGSAGLATRYTSTGD